MTTIFHRKNALLEAAKQLQCNYILIDFLNAHEYHKFTYFKLNNSFFRKLQSISINNRYYANEIVINGVKRKPYLDIDKVYLSEDTANTTRSFTIETLQNDIIAVFKSAYNQILTKSDILILDSSGKTTIKKSSSETIDGYKLSFHVIISPSDRNLFYLNSKYSNSSAIHFYTLLTEFKHNTSLDPIYLDVLQYHYKNLLDPQVYNTDVNLRIIGSHKTHNSDRVLLPIDPITHQFIDLSSVNKLNYLLTYFNPNLPNVQLVTPVITKSKSHKIIIKDTPHKTNISANLLKLVQKHHPTAKYKSTVNTLHNFNYTNRKEPCPTSDLIHSGTNGFYVYECHTGYLMKCHSNKCKKYQPLHIGYVDECDELIQNAVQVNTQFLLEDNHTKELVDHWASNDFILAIKSAMATGKTKLINYVIQNYIFKNILWISHRQTLTKNLIGAFKELGFVDYLSVEGSLYNYDRILIQIDSIHRIIKFIDGDNICSYKKYDLVIIDEIESNLSHYSSPYLYKGDIDSRSTFDYILKVIQRSNKLLLLDADMGVRTKLLLDHFNNYTLVYNNYMPAKRTFIVTNERDYFMENIKADLLAKKNICICSMSAKELKKMVPEFEEMGIKYVLHTSMSDDKLKNQLINVNEFWIQFQCIMYSPTIESGVDFNVKHIDKMYCILKNGKRTCSQRSLLQMTGRIRQIEDLQILCFYNMLTESEPDLLADIYTFSNLLEYFETYESLNKHKIMRRIENHEIDNGDEVIIVKKSPQLSLYDQIMIHNETENMNKEMDTFLTILNKLIQRAGHQLRFRYRPKKVKEEPDEYDSDLETNDDEVILTGKAEKIAQILSIDDTNYNIDELRKKQSKSELSAIEKLVLERFFCKQKLRLQKDIPNSIFEKYLNIYIEKEDEYQRYRYLFGYDTIPEHEFDHISIGMEKARLNIIVDLYNLLTDSSINELTLPEFEPIELSNEEYQNGILSIVNKSIYFKNPIECHSLFFTTKIRNRKKVKSQQKKLLDFDQSHTKTIQDIFESYNIKLERGERKQINGVRSYSYILQINDDMKRIINHNIEQ
jgi:Origin of replication binding protein